MNENNSKQREPVDEWQMKMAERIVIERKKKGWTQEKLAEEVGRDTGTVASWEQGRVVPPFKCMVKLADMFNCDLDYLTGRMDIKAHDTKYIHGVTGLSVKAIEKICAEKATINGSPVPGPTAISLSHLIESDGFSDLMIAYQTFMAAAIILKESVIPEAKPYPVDKDGNMILDESTNSDDGAYTVIGNNKVTLQIDEYAKFCIDQVSKAMIRLCEPEFRESYAMCMRNTKKNGRRDK